MPIWGCRMTEWIRGIAVIAAFVAAAFALWLYRTTERHNAELSGSVPSIVAVLASHRCVSFLESNPKLGKQPPFLSTGLAYHGPDESGQVFSTKDRSVFVSLSILDDANANCLIDDREIPWSVDARLAVEAYATAFASEYIQEPYETQDLSDDTGFATHTLHRPADGVGKYVMYVNASAAPGRPYSFVSLGYATFELGGKDA